MKRVATGLLLFSQEASGQPPTPEMMHAQTPRPTPIQLIRPTDQPSPHPLVIFNYPREAIGNTHSEYKQHFCDAGLFTHVSFTPPEYYWECPPEYVVRWNILPARDKYCSSRTSYEDAIYTGTASQYDLTIKAAAYASACVSLENLKKNHPIAWNMAMKELEPCGNENMIFCKSSEESPESTLSPTTGTRPKR